MNGFLCGRVLKFQFWCGVFREKRILFIVLGYCVQCTCVKTLSFAFFCFHATVNRGHILNNCRHPWFLLNRFYSFEIGWLQARRTVMLSILSFTHDTFRLWTSGCDQEDIYKKPGFVGVEYVLLLSKISVILSEQRDLSTMAIPRQIFSNLMACRFVNYESQPSLAPNSRAWAKNFFIQHETADGYVLFSTLTNPLLQVGKFILTWLFSLLL